VYAPHAPCMTTPLSPIEVWDSSSALPWSFAPHLGIFWARETLATISFLLCEPKFCNCLYIFQGQVPTCPWLREILHVPSLMGGLLHLPTHAKASCDCFLWFDNLLFGIILTLLTNFWLTLGYDQIGLKLNFLVCPVYFFSFFSKILEQVNRRNITTWLDKS